MWNALLCLLSLGAAPGALAQEPAPSGATADEPAPVEAAPAAQPPTLPGADGLTDEQRALRSAEAGALYKVGVDLMGRGSYAEADAVFQRVATDYVGTEYAGMASTQILVLKPLLSEAPATDAPKPTRATADRGEPDGRVELVVSQALIVPGVTGILIPGTFGWLDGGPTGPVLLFLGGMGAGIGGSLAFSARHEVTAGQTMALTAGELIGGWNGLATALMLTPMDSQPAFALITGSTVIGGGLGALAAVQLRPSAGDMAMVRSAATWGTTASALSFLIAPADEVNGVAGRLVAGTDIGLAIGAGLASQLELSRGRMNLINVGGYAGMATTGGVALLVGAANGLSPEATAGLLYAGAAAGLATAAWATRDLDGAAWADGGTGALITRDEGGWKLGVPLPSVTLSERELRPMGMVELARGVW